MLRQSSSLTKAHFPVPAINYIGRNARSDYLFPVTGCQYLKYLRRSRRISGFVKLPDGGCDAADDREIGIRAGVAVVHKGVEGALDAVGEDNIFCGVAAVLRIFAENQFLDFRLDPVCKAALFPAGKQERDQR